MSSTWSVCLLRVRREDASASLVTKAMTALVAVTTVTMVMVVKAGVAVVRLKHVILWRELVTRTVRRDGLDLTATEVSSGGGSSGIGSGNSSNSSSSSSCCSRYIVCVCEACTSGRYGRNCAEQCQCSGSQCHPETGQCVCEAGRLGPNCTQGRSLHYIT